MFIFKKLFANLFFPVPLIVLFLACGLYYLWFTKKQITGKIIITMAFTLLLALSNFSISSKMLAPLEGDYLKYEIPPPEEGSCDLIEYIVVLGSGHVTDPRISVTSQLNKSSVVRLVEGIRLHNKHPESKLVLSGGSTSDPKPEAVIMADMAEQLGVDSNNIIIEDQSKDTKDEALFLKDILGESEFLLVTSASHMHRSLALFKKQGMHPIPASASNYIRGTPTNNFNSFIPNSYNLIRSKRAIYEYLGIVWASFRGQI